MNTLLDDNLTGQLTLELYNTIFVINNSMISSLKNFDYEIMPKIFPIDGFIDMRIFKRFINLQVN